MLYLALSPACVQCYSALPGTLVFGIALAIYSPVIWAIPPYFHLRTQKS
jgi:hypothetical protein